MPPHREEGACDFLVSEITLSFAEREYEFTATLGWQCSRQLIVISKRLIKQILALLADSSKHKEGN